MTTAEGFTPHWASAPGETILKLMIVRNLTPQTLATELSISNDRVRRLLSGQMPLTRELAVAIARLLGSTERFWLERDRQFQAAQARLEGNLPKGKQWLRTLPLAEMRNAGAFPPDSERETLLEDCFNFFDVSSVEEWDERYSTLVQQVRFRTSDTFDSKLGSLAYWLRQGELAAERIQCGRWNSTGFLHSLVGIRKLTRRKDPASFLPELERICAENGVALVVQRAPKGCVASGATRFLADTKALLLLSCRFLSDDQFWFSFFHEAGHLVLHDKKTFVEASDKAMTGEELEANAFAEEILIPSVAEAQVSSVPKRSKELLRLAIKLGISPGILVGQMQHRELLLHSEMNFLKKRYTWESSSSEG